MYTHTVPRDVDGVENHFPCLSSVSCEGDPAVLMSNLCLDVLKK